jgi:hypothetical protein
MAHPTTAAPKADQMANLYVVGIFNLSFVEGGANNVAEDIQRLR